MHANAAMLVERNHVVVSPTPGHWELHTNIVALYQP
jgi:hypothetical protein